MLAAHKTARPAPRLPEDEQRHEPARLRRRARARGVAAPRRVAAGRRDLADDALHRRRRPTRRASRQRWQRSRRRRATCPANARSPTARRRCASACAWRRRVDWVRPGILLYGSAPDFLRAHVGRLAPAPAMTLRTRLIATQTLAPGGDHRLRQQLHRRARDAHRRRRLRLRRRLPAAGAGATHGTPVLVDGVRTRTVGRVSMDMITVDLEAGADGDDRQRGHAVGPRRQRRGAVDRRRRAPLPAPSATS